MISKIVGGFFLFLIFVTIVIFKNYGFTLTQSLILGIFITAASFLFYQFVLKRKLSVKVILLFFAGFYLGLYLAKGITLSLYPSSPPSPTCRTYFSLLFLTFLPFWQLNLEQINP